MSAPPLHTPATLSASGYEDGLGRRTLIFDREYGVMLERLGLRPELAAFEDALKARLSRLATIEDERVARVRTIETDPDSGVLTVVSEFVAGQRLCDLLDSAASLGRDENPTPSVDVALGFLLDVLPALAALHATTGLTHGALGPGRMVLTAAGQVVLLDALFGNALERLRFSRARLWSDLRIAMPHGEPSGRFDIAADIAQVTLCGVALAVGRPLGDGDYPEGLPALLTEVVEIAQIRGSAVFASGLQRVLQRTLPLPGQRPYGTADEALTELQRVIHQEMGAAQCLSALTEFGALMSRTAAPPPRAAAPTTAAMARPLVARPTPSNDAEIEIALDEELEMAARDEVIELSPVVEMPVVTRSKSPAKPAPRLSPKLAAKPVAGKEPFVVAPPPIALAPSPIAPPRPRPVEVAPAARLAPIQEIQPVPQPKQVKATAQPPAPTVKSAGAPARMVSGPVPPAVISAPVPVAIPLVVAARRASSEPQAPSVAAPPSQAASARVEPSQASVISTAPDVPAFEADAQPQALPQVLETSSQPAAEAVLPAPPPAAPAPPVLAPPPQAAAIVETLGNASSAVVELPPQPVAALVPPPPEPPAEPVSAPPPPAVPVVEAHAAVQPAIVEPSAKPVSVVAEPPPQPTVTASAQQRAVAVVETPTVAVVAQPPAEPAAVVAEPTPEPTVTAPAQQPVVVVVETPTVHLVAEPPAEAVTIAPAVVLGAAPVVSHLPMPVVAVALPMPAASEPATTPPHEDQASATSRRKRLRGSKAKRDKLRSNSVTRDKLRSNGAPLPAPVAQPRPVAPPPPVVAAPAAVPAPLRQTSSPAMETVWQAPPIPPPVPEPRRIAAPLPPPIVPMRADTLWQPPTTQVTLAPMAATATVQAPVGATVRLKVEPPTGYTPVSPRRVDPRNAWANVGPPGHIAGRDEGPSPFPWKLAAAVILVMVVGVGAGRAYLPDRVPDITPMLPILERAAPSVVLAPPTSRTAGTLVLETQPAGARVLLDGKLAGQTPLTIEEVPPGRHIVTFITSGGAVKRTVRVEAGKSTALDVPVFSGWVAVFAPVVLDIAENGRSIGNTEQSRLLLSPGTHVLTFSNRELGFSAEQTVDIEAGEERAVTLDPRGTLSLNAQPWAEIWIDGKKAGETPLANLSVPIGTRDVVFKHPDFGERRLTAIVTAKGPTALGVDFTKAGRD